MIDSDTLYHATGIRSPVGTLGGVGDLYSRHADNIISYIVREDLIPILEQNDCISHVFCLPELASAIPDDISLIICDDPTWSYFSLVDFLATKRAATFSESTINPTSSTEGSWVASTGVTIGAGVKLEPFCSVYNATEIAADTLVRSGAAVGLDSFQHQRTSKGIISPKHDGDLKIGERVEIGANCAISRGFSYRHTIIEDNVKIDANVSISHGVRIGKGSILCAGALILGHSTIGENVFIGPGATVRNRVTVGASARISIGSVVTKDVPPDSTVTGNFAVPHDDWLAFMKRLGK